MVKGLNIRGQRSFRSHGFSIFIEEERNGKSYEAKITLDMVERELYSADTTENTLFISDEATQLLMDDLWAAGYRPGDGNGSVGQLKATQDHLADMKKIVFHGLKIK